MIPISWGQATQSCPRVKKASICRVNPSMSEFALLTARSINMTILGIKWEQLLCIPIKKNLGVLNIFYLCNFWSEASFCLQLLFFYF